MGFTSSAIGRFATATETKACPLDDFNHLTWVVVFEEKWNKKWNRKQERSLEFQCSERPTMYKNYIDAWLKLTRLLYKLRCAAIDNEIRSRNGLCAQDETNSEQVRKASDKKATKKNHGSGKMEKKRNSKQPNADEVTTHSDSAQHAPIHKLQSLNNETNYRHLQLTAIHNGWGRNCTMCPAVRIEM